MSKYPKISIGVGALVINSSNQILLIKRKKGQTKWSIPSGYVAKNETIYQTIIREVKEETGIKIKVRGLIGLRQKITEAGGYNIWVLTIAKYISGKVKADFDEVVDADFFDIKKTKEIELAESTKLFLKKFINKKLSLLIIEKKISNDKYMLFL
jgi:ADP-ribose pyrophosphatase YjhB (NUDIX family)